MRTRGFTLIELLVVIAIIGILASVVIASLNEARVKARDARRMSDLNQIRSALELYHLEHGHYPIISPQTWASFDAPSYMNNGVVNPAAANISTALEPYLPGNMKDPVGGTGDTGYLYRSETTSSGASYCVLMYRVPENMNNFPAQVIPMNRCTAINNGQCTGINALYIGNGPFASGC